MQNIILTTGGTGGHIFPALAVAEELLQRGDVRLLFVGSLYGPEKELATKAGLEFMGLPVRGILGRGFHAVGAAFNMMRAFVSALGIMRKFRPQIVLGFGGYAAFAPIMAAQALGISTAVHEQNAVAGLSNKVQGRFAKKVFLGMPETQGFAEKKCIVTGNPVRVAVAQVSANEHDFSGKRLLVVGGSQGARALNDLIIENFAKCNTENIIIRHQSGAKDFERVHKAYVSAGQDTTMLSAFIDDMAAAYDWADLVLCRSGASTVAELSAAGRGAIFVPFPFATHDHQTHNAKLLVKHGAAKMHAESQMKKEDTMGNIINLLNDKNELQKMSKAALSVNMGNAAKNIVDNLI